MAEAIVTLPDGRRVRMSGPTREAVEAKAREFASGTTGPDPDVPQVDAQGNVAPGPEFDRPARPQEPAGSTAQAVAAGAGERLMGNIMAIPDAPLRLFNPVANAVRETFGQPRRPAPSFGLPLPSGRQAASGVEAVGAQLAQAGPGEGRPPQTGTFGLPFRTERGPMPTAETDLQGQFQQRMQQRGQMEQDRPGAFGVGEFLGDAGTIASGRAPMVRGSGGMFDEAIKTGLESVSKALNRPSGMVGVKRTADRVISSDVFKDLARGAGRAAETGVEGAAISILQDGDPMETAAFAAGSQAASSFANTAVEHTTGLLDEADGKMGPVSKNLGWVGRKAGSVGLYAGVGGVIYELLINDSPSSSIAQNLDKIGYTFLMGATVGMMGRRTNPEGVLKEFPKLADAMQTIPRTGILKLAQSATENPELKQTMDTIARNPSAFTGGQLDQITRALRSDDPGAGVLKMIDEDERFREAVEAPDPRLAGVPVRGDDE